MIHIALTGLNGYGGHFVEVLLTEGSEAYQLTAVVSRNPEKSEYFERIRQAGVSIYTDLASCLEQEEVQLVIIATPMHIHAQEAMLALDHNASVYCEKPLACTLSQYEAIIDKTKEKGQYAAVGFHWSYAPAIRALKQDLLAGKYGRVLSAKASAIWNRDQDYYAQSTWKGRLVTSQGEPLYESVMSNCAAHSMHNILFLLGDKMNKSAQMLHPQASCFRAHDIQGFDTICLKGETKQQQTLYYTATTAADEPCPAEFEILCERAKIIYPSNDKNEITAYIEDSGMEQSAEPVVYGNPEENRFQHFKEVVDSINTRKPLLCDAETVLPFGRIVEWVNLNVPIQNIPEHMIIKEDRSLLVKGLSAILTTAYDQMKENPFP